MLGNEEVQGIYILAASEIFTLLHNGTYGDGLGLWISFYEIYCGQLFDLLNGRARYCDKIIKRALILWVRFYPYIQSAQSYFELFLSSVMY